MKQFIKNTKELSITPARKHILEIAEAALMARRASSSDTCPSARETATTPLEFWLSICEPSIETFTREIE